MSREVFKVVGIDLLLVAFYLDSMLEDLDDGPCDESEVKSPYEAISRKDAEELREKIEQLLWKIEYLELGQKEE